MHKFEQAKKHLEAIDENATEFTFQTFDDSGKQNKSLCRIFHGTLKKHWKVLVDLNKQGAGIFVTVNETDLEGRKKENIIGVRFLYLDDDGGAIEPPIEPHIRVKTSRSKQHLYYALEPNEWLEKDFEEYQNFLDLFVNTYKGDPRAKDLSRVLRLAGFYNMKQPKNPFLVTVKTKDISTYSKMQILDMLPKTDKGKNANSAARKKSFILPDTILSGERNDTLFKYARSLSVQGIDSETVKFMVSDANQKNTIEPLTNGELQNLIKSALSYPNDKSFYMTTDMGNAERFYDDWQNDLLYCADEKKWYIWDEKAWVKDDTNQVLEKAKMTAKHLMLDAKGRGEEGVERAIKWANGTQSLSRLSSMIRLAESMLPCKSNKFNNNDMQLNLSNCILDLNTGEMIPHDRKYYHSLIIPVEYDPDATCPEFEKFLNTIFQGDQSLIDYIQRIMGYLLTGDTSEQCIFILLGDGRNGKSTLINTIIELMGPYHSRANADTFLKENRYSIRSDHARLKGARVVSASEAGDDKYWDEALIKDISGGEKVTARLLYENESEFLPKFKLVIAVNSLPQIKGTDGGIWRRIRVIPFDHIIPKDRVDLQLSQKLKAELSGILNFTLKGNKKWRKYGLSEPEMILNRTEDFRREMDRVQAFIDEKCFEKEGVKVPASLLYTVYQSWAFKNGYHPLSNNKFGRQFKAKGYKSQKARYEGEVQQVYFDIGLNDSTPDEDD